MPEEAVAIDILSDESMLKILHLASITPMSLVDLSDACEITGAACFRRLSDLKRMGLVEEVSKDEDPEAMTHLYRSDVKRIELQFRDGHIYTVIEGGEGGIRTNCVDPLSGISLPWNGCDEGGPLDWGRTAQLSPFF